MKRLLPLLLLLGLGPASGSSALSQSVLESMGRLEQTPRDCSRNLVLKKQNGDCARVVVDQIDRDFLTVSFYARGAERDSSNKLSFGGTTNRSMVCEASRCRVAGPIQLETSFLSVLRSTSTWSPTSKASSLPLVLVCDEMARLIICCEVACRMLDVAISRIR